MNVLIPLLALTLGTGALETDKDQIVSVVTQYHEGFQNNDPEMVLEILGDQLIMWNGNFSDNPSDWQAHLFLSEKTLNSWPQDFLNEAGPYSNSFRVINVNIRQNAAIAVTIDSGQNKFRSWDKETTVWQLGKINGQWKIVGMFIRNISNPE